MWYFYFFIELTSVQELENYVERVVRFEDLREFHVVIVVKVAHDFDLFYETLLTILLTVGCLFGKSLHRIFLFVFEALHEVDRGEVTLTDLLDGFELLVESDLI